MKVNYKNIVNTLYDELNKIKQYSKTVDIDKLKNRIEVLQIANTTFDGHDELDNKLDKLISKKGGNNNEIK